MTKKCFFYRINLIVAGWKVAIKKKVDKIEAKMKRLPQLQFLAFVTQNKSLNSLTIEILNFKNIYDDVYRNGTKKRNS